MNYKQLAKDFWQNGYIVIPGFFEEDLMGRLDANINRHFGDNPEFSHEAEFIKKSKTEVIPWFPQNPDLEGYSTDLASPFDQLESDQRFEQLTKAILGEGWEPLYSMVMFSKTGSSGQAWHQDCPPEDSLKFNMNRLIYTQDHAEYEGGLTVVMPGTHRRGELTVGDPNEDMQGQVILQPQKGMLILLHGHTWHRVLPISSGVRYSTNFRVCPQGTPADITDIAVYRNMRYSFYSNSVIEEREPLA